MGIPSFYKHLLQTITGLTTKTRPPPALFGLDLNCAIYHCVKKVQKQTPYTPEIQLVWERKLIDHVLAYITQMTKIVNPTQTVYVAVDGVAPMAKIKQQRCRRFKSAVEAAAMAKLTAEAKGIPYVNEPRWDTNAITPGTQFMANLSNALRDYASKSQKIVVSPADEPGEGEQKIMDYIRIKKPSSSVVYGLDADLIVLSLLTGVTTHSSIDLFREETEFNGSIKTDALDQEQFLYMDITQLATYLFSKYSHPTQSKQQFIYDFVGLMSLLGNDFVPHGMGLKIRDEGIPILMELYSNVETHLVEPNNWTYNKEALISLLDSLAQEEPKMILKSVKRKLETRVGSTGSKDPVEQAMARYNDTPVLWAAERPLIQYVKDESMEKPQIQLRPNWEQTYDKLVFHDAPLKDATHLYIQSILWTLKYYSGQPIDTWYYYPHHLPPRAKTVVEYLKNRDVEAPTTRRPALEPKTQLAMVLPQTSYHLLPPNYMELVKKYPYAFPIAWGTYSFGRRFMWECEPLIPLVQPSQMKTWITELR
jgi:5'-3' exonuclease